MITDEQVTRFAALFSGLDTAYGTGVGGWVKQPPQLQQYKEHLEGRGPGLGIAPLREDGKVKFAAIDLDEPDFENAQVMASLLPGPAFIERSRSGNAHVLVFFKEPMEAWVPRGIMREATAAVGKRFVEVFPKQDKLRIGMVGNYINLAYYGNSRPVLDFEKDSAGWELPLNLFLDAVYCMNGFNDPDNWRKRAGWLGVPSPEERQQTSHREFGTSSFLHQCAEWTIANREENPVIEGHRAVVYFALSKQLANCNQFTKEERLMLLGLVNDASPDPIPEHELHTIYNNAERGQFTSTGCDDPLFAPYAHPDCPIAHGRR